MRLERQTNETHVIWAHAPHEALSLTRYIQVLSRLQEVWCSKLPSSSPDDKVFNNSDDRAGSQYTFGSTLWDSLLSIHWRPCVRSMITSSKLLTEGFLRNVSKTARKATIGSIKTLHEAPSSTKSQRQTPTPGTLTIKLQALGSPSSNC